MDFDLNQALILLVDKYNQSKSDYENFINLRSNDLKLPENIAMPLARNFAIDMINEPWEISTYYRENDYEHYNQHVIKYIKTFNEYRKVFIKYRQFTFWIKTIIQIKNFLDNQEEHKLHSDYFVFNKNNNFASLYKMLEDVDQPIIHQHIPIFNQPIINMNQLNEYIQMEQIRGENIFKLIIDKIREHDINWNNYNFNYLEFNNSYIRVMRMI